MKPLHLALAAALTLCTTFVRAAETNQTPKFESRSLKDCLRPAIKNGGFNLPGHILWCSSVIKVGDTYHMFASEWPAEFGLSGWTSHSECVRAISTNLCGPYTFQEVVLQ
jgi:hypothetical protein